MPQSCVGLSYDVYIIEGEYKAINNIDHKDSATLVSIRSAAGNKKKQKAHASSAETSLDTSLAQFRSLIKQQVQQQEERVTHLWDSAQ